MKEQGSTLSAVKSVDASRPPGYQAEPLGVGGSGMAGTSSAQGQSVPWADTEEETSIPGGEELTDQALAELRRRYSSLLSGLLKRSYLGDDDLAEDPEGLIAKVGAWIKNRRQESRRRAREELVARYSVFARQLSKASDVDLYNTGVLGLRALIRGRLSAARVLAEDIHFATSTQAALGQVVRGLLYFLAIFFAVLGAATVSLFVTRGRSIEALVESIQYYGALPLAVVFGCLGGCVSLLQRISDFDAAKGRSQRFLFLTGFSLPIVGGIFAAVIASLLISKIINLNVDVADPNALGTVNTGLFVVVGFLSGFSERFTHGLLATAESTLGSAAGATQKRDDAARSADNTGQTDA
jgi:hypothetical protein